MCPNSYLSNCSSIRCELHVSQAVQQYFHLLVLLVWRLRTTFKCLWGLREASELGTWRSKAWASLHEAVWRLVVQQSNCKEEVGCTHRKRGRNTRKRSPQVLQFMRGSCLSPRCCKEWATPTLATSSGTIWVCRTKGPLLSLSRHLALGPLIPQQEAATSSERAHAQSRAHPLKAHV